MVSSIRLTMKMRSAPRTIQMIDPRRLQDYTMSERSIVSQSFRVYIALYITLLIHLAIQKEAVHSVSHFEGQDISSKQKKDESGTFNHMATAHIKATVKGHEANSSSYFVMDIKSNLCLFCVLFFRPLISRNIWLKGPECEDKRAIRLQDYPQDNPPGTIHPPIIHYWHIGLSPE